MGINNPIKLATETQTSPWKTISQELIDFSFQTRYMVWLEMVLEFPHTCKISYLRGAHILEYVNGSIVSLLNFANIEI